ncbi:hypothetical protein JTE90_028335 [Oedothorax gibbosus]|uniref:Uncharacterized protein n=1 Tax=Oedothorax gibbosus TaxID=931172 RepID=A0AAV6V4A2_9ARAC|nr:hypothetical protein JTE90_028335 [Oedothorax gibbosus]
MGRSSSGHVLALSRRNDQGCHEDRSPNGELLVMEFEMAIVRSSLSETPNSTQVYLHTIPYHLYALTSVCKTT